MGEPVCRPPWGEAGSSLGRQAAAVFCLCLLIFQFWCLLFADWKSSTELPGLSRATTNKEENVIWKAPSPAPVSSPGMLTAGETPSKEPQDRCGTGNLQGSMLVTGEVSMGGRGHQLAVYQSSLPL